MKCNSLKSRFLHAHFAWISDLRGVFTQSHFMTTARLANKKTVERSFFCISYVYLKNVCLFARDHTHRKVENTMSRQISGSFFGGSGSSGGRSGSSGGGSGSSGGGSGSSGGGSGSGRWASQLPWLRWGAGQPQRRANVLPFLALPAPALKAVFRNGGETIRKRWGGGGGGQIC
jgi:hypothetical protein